MERRAFLGTLAGGLLASPLAAGAQRVRVYRVGVVLQGARTREPSTAALQSRRAPLTSTAWGAQGLSMGDYVRGTAARGLADRATDWS